MSRLPGDIWHQIATKLAPRDLSNFILTHRQAKDALGQSQIDNMKLWNSVFQDYSWADEALSHGLAPVLIRQIRDKRPYIYLFLAKKGVTDENAPLFDGIHDEIKKSLRSQTVGRTLCEIEYENFTLNISHVIWRTLILSKDFRWFQEGTNNQVAIYGDRIHWVKAEAKYQFAFIRIPGCKDFAIFWHRSLHEHGFPDYSQSG
jgi:hypothetical protein